MNTGRMRFRVDLVRDTLTSDDLGDMVPTPTTVGTYWADVVPLTGREAVNARQLKAETTHRVTLRWLGNVTIGPTDHLIHRGRKFNVLWVNNVDERNRQLDVYCTEVVSPS